LQYWNSFDIKLNGNSYSINSVYINEVYFNFMPTMANDFKTLEPCNSSHSSSICYIIFESHITKSLRFFQKRNNLMLINEAPTEQSIRINFLLNLEPSKIWHHRTTLCRFAIVTPLISFLI
jgi:hypothetical protein